MAKQPKVKMVRTLKREVFSRSPVDIIIPFRGAYQKVIRLVESILFTTKSNPYQICLVDDCSTNDRFVDFLKEAPQVVSFRTPEHLGFAGALKYGFERTEQPWVVFMHSDCVVSDQGWLIELGRSLVRWQEKKEPVKMVSARTNNPGEGTDPRLKTTKQTKSNDMIAQTHLPLFCSMFNRQLFDHIGGFVKEYFPCWYEEEELAYRMKHYGYKQGICGKSWVAHEGGVTVNALLKEDPEMKSKMENNRTRCVEDMKLLNS